MNLYCSQGINRSISSVILSGSNTKNFNTKDKKNWNKSEKIKLITHHRSDNWMKGFKIYQKIDNLLNDKSFGLKITYFL